MLAFRDRFLQLRDASRDPTTEGRCHFVVFEVQYLSVEPPFEIGDLRLDLREVIRPAYRNLIELLSGKTEDEYDRMVAAVEQLIDKGETQLSPEESALLETMAILVQAYDDRYHPLPALAPSEMLAYLMETSGRAAKDLLPVFGTRDRVSEVLNGKRSISKEQAKKLATVFNVAIDLFI